MKLGREDDTSPSPVDTAEEAHQTLLNLNLLLAGSIILAMLLGFMCRRADAAERIDVVGDVGMVEIMLTPSAIRTAGPDLVLLIDSNGGLLEGARQIGKALDERRQRGLRTKCYALKAISAAFIIFAACDERYISPYGKAMMHYAYLVVPRVTIDEVDVMQKRMHEMKKEIDAWAERVFKQQAPLMKQYMVEERIMSGKELCNTFTGFCHVSYIFPILEN